MLTLKCFISWHELDLHGWAVMWKLILIVCPLVAWGDFRVFFVSLMLPFLPQPPGKPFATLCIQNYCVIGENFTATFVYAENSPNCSTSRSHYFSQSAGWIAGRSNCLSTVGLKLWTPPARFWSDSVQVSVYKFQLLPFSIFQIMLLVKKKKIILKCSKKCSFITKPEGVFALYHHSSLYCFIFFSISSFITLCHFTLSHSWTYLS